MFDRNRGAKNVNSTTEVHPQKELQQTRLELQVAKTINGLSQVLGSVEELCGPHTTPDEDSDDDPG